MKKFDKSFIFKFQQSHKGDGDLVVVEGVHAIKHAWRFGAKFECIVTQDKKQLLRLTQEMATEKEVDFLSEEALEISEELFEKISPRSICVSAKALVHKPEVLVISKWSANKPIVFIQNPRDLNNAGAVVRVAAGFGVAGVLTSGTVNLWHAGAIRAGAGLQFALPIAEIDDSLLFESFGHRQIIACDAEGENMYQAKIPAGAILVFGTERGGITTEIKSRADKIISIPMQPKISSLNLATSVSAVLYGVMRR